MNMGESQIQRVFNDKSSSDPGHNSTYKCSVIRPPIVVNERFPLSVRRIFSGMDDGDELTLTADISEIKEKVGVGEARAVAIGNTYIGLCYDF